jgi:hypothetical protein
VHEHVGDGGIRSSTNEDLAEGMGTASVLTPLPEVHRGAIQDEERTSTLAPGRS